MRFTVLLCALACACGEKRRPIGRGDAGPSVVVLDGRTVDLGTLPPAVPEHEPNDTMVRAEPLVGRIAGVVSAKPDVDLFRVLPPTVTPDVDAGGAIAVATITLRNGAQPVVLDVLDEKGKAIFSRETAAHAFARVTSLRLDTLGTVRVRRSSKTTADADYTIDATVGMSEPGQELEPNDDVKRANVLADNGNATGVIDPGDRDSLALPTRPLGTTWRIELAAQPDVAPELRGKRGDFTLFTTRASKGGELQLRNAPAGEGIVLQLRDVDGASDQAASRGTASPFGREEGQPYALRITSEPALDVAIEAEPNDDHAHANMVKAGDVAGYLWPGDVDWFCTSGGIGAHVDAMPEVDFKLELTDNAGITIAKADEGKRGSAENLLPDARAACVKVSAHGRDTAFDAPYRLTISSAGSPAGSAAQPAANP